MTSNSFMDHVKSKSIYPIRPSNGYFHNRIYLHDRGIHPFLRQASSPFPSPEI